METPDEANEEAKAEVSNELIGEAHRERPFHWFRGESVRELYDRLTEYNPDYATLKVYQHGQHMEFSVEGDEGPPINNSHICPIDCP